MRDYRRSHQRPRFIKTEFTTPQVWQELCQFDPTLIIGALGGPYRSARETLQLAHDVITYGGQVILFGRSIFLEEKPRLMARALRAVLDREKAPDEALREYQANVR